MQSERASRETPKRYRCFGTDVWRLWRACTGSSVPVLFLWRWCLPRNNLEFDHTTPKLGRWSSMVVQSWHRINLWALLGRERARNVPWQHWLSWNRIDKGNIRRMLWIEGNCWMHRCRRTGVGEDRGRNSWFRSFQPNKPSTLINVYDGGAGAN